MQSATDYKPNQSFALMLIGPPKAGKTVFALNFPDPYVLDCDNNLAGALRYHNNMDGSQFPFWFDNPMTGEPDPEKRSAYCMTHLQAAARDPQPKSLIVDGLSLIAEYLQHVILSKSQDRNLIISGEKVMAMQHWAPFKNLLSKLIMACKASGKYFIMTCHEDTLTNDAGAVIGYRPLVSGSLRHNIAGYFTDVWRCETMDKAGVAQYQTRFQPRNLMQIGNSLNIEATHLDTTKKSREEVWAKLSNFFPGADETVASSAATDTDNNQ